ncbi:MAG: alanine racemase [Deltaproteobacteria bacterium]|nr:alanine racemase [Deltaproteobacteria bacterium]
MTSVDKQPIRLVQIDLAALRHNLITLKALAGPGVKMLAVVKSDAYGHGLVPASQVFAEAGADFLGVFDLEEAVSIRAAGLDLPVVLMGGVAADYAEEVIRLRLSPVIWDVATARCLAAAAVKSGRSCRVHIKVDTGMGRLGVTIEEAVDFIQSISTLEGLSVEAVMSHLAEADGPEVDYTRVQEGRFQSVTDQLAATSCQPGTMWHLANSAGLLYHPTARLDLVRPGIALYGSPPTRPRDCSHQSPTLKPAMTFKSRVIQIKEIPAGAAIGYGCTFRAQGRMRLAVAPVGYRDGFFRALSNKGVALIRGRRVPLIGSVCMNLTMFDITQVPEVLPGDEIVFLGQQGRGRIMAEEIAAAAGTISYEVYCALGRLNPREYLWSD